MATAHPLGISSHHIPEWNGDEGCQNQSNTQEVCLDPYFSHCLFRIGIYGWRKRCLYFLIILLGSLVVINLSLTVWIIKVLDFTMDGMGNLKIRKDGIRVEGQSIFLKSLYASQIQSRQDQPLWFESSRNITINTRNSKGIVTSKLNLGDGRLDVYTSQFIVKKPNGDVLLKINEDEVIMAANRLRVSGDGGVIFDGSIQTPLVKSEPSRQLKLESPTRKLRVLAPEGVGIESRAGDISATCLKDFKLESKEGSIWLDSEHVLLRNLRTVLPTSRGGQSYHGIYAMCSCENGRLFLSAPDGHCQADEVVCQ
ncbi:delta-sarcoglycan [Parasteatoda tepidariorum]|uniref:delta-sarcoglycan n=1 Tax=Parasteatoda tepidariorum TaxID=114398 RepID=UPI00077FC44C|nr:delta-sarcoglycan [Parasteatoda tepidariorum]